MGWMAQGGWAGVSWVPLRLANGERRTDGGKWEQGQEKNPGLCDPSWSIGSCRDLAFRKIHFSWAHTSEFMDMCGPDEDACLWLGRYWALLSMCVNLWGCKPVDECENWEPGGWGDPALLSRLQWEPGDRLA